MSEVIAIVGGGFSGTVLAVNLLRRCRGARIVLIERGAHVGRGVAYAERDIPYVLNVPAQRLSADSRAPLDFLQFARAHVPGAGPEDFLPRALYGRYLASRLDQAARACAGRNQFERVHDEVLDVAPAAGGGFEVSLQQAPPLAARRVVLAVGVPAGQPAAWTQPLQGHPAFHPDPWQPPSHLDARHTALIVGNGLTMADVATALSWQRTAVPLLHTLSRRGVLPQRQTDFEAGSAAGGETLLACAASARQLLRASRAYAAAVQRAGGDWRQVVTRIRQLVPRLWHALPPVERRRFMRHLRVHWEAHRHRMPPQIAAHLAHLQSMGRLKVNAGRVLGAEPEGARIRVWWRPRGGIDGEPLDVDALLLATGPETRLSRQTGALVRALCRRGLITADALDLGLRVAATGECLDGGGTPVRDLYYLGPMLRAEYWEATAVTELRNLAEALAQRLGAADA